MRQSIKSAFSVEVQLVRYGHWGTRWRSIALLGAPVLLLFGCGHDDTSNKPTVPSDAAPHLAESKEALVGFEKVALVTQDGAAGTRSPTDRGPRGRFYLRATGSVFEWYLFVDGLDTARAYQVELQVDRTGGYAIASLRADSTGKLGGHGALKEFADRLCHTSASFTPPHSLAGSHEISVRVKEDGSPNGGSALGRSLMSPSENGVPCTGNGDGSFEYRLFAEHTIKFRGDSTAGIP